MQWPPGYQGSSLQGQPQALLCPFGAFEYAMHNMVILEINAEKLIIPALNRRITYRGMSLHRFAKVFQYADFDHPQGRALNLGRSRVLAANGNFDDLGQCGS